MKQSDDSKAFFEKYGFTASLTKKHPEFKDEMSFEGLECNYVTSLENQISDLKTYISIQNNKIDFLMNKEIYKWQRENEKKV